MKNQLKKLTSQKIDYMKIDFAKKTFGIIFFYVVIILHSLRRNSDWLSNLNGGDSVFGQVSDKKLLSFGVTGEDLVVFPEQVVNGPIQVWHGGWVKLPPTRIANVPNGDLRRPAANHPPRITRPR